MTTSGIADAMDRGPLVLDGGLATLLEAHGHDLSSSLWSARLLLEDPGALVAAHAEFYAAGAVVAITSSYQVSRSGFVAAGLAPEQADVALRRSVALAARARDETPDNARRFVAASVGPYGATLADGSEYRGDYGLSPAQLRDWHAPRFDVLAGAGADVLAVETIPCLAEVQALCELVSGSGVPAWLSITASGGRTRAGEPVVEAFAMARDVDEIIAVGVNCVRVDEVGDLVRQAVEQSGKPGVAYPNSGEGWDGERRVWIGARGGVADVAGDPVADGVGNWVAAGARLVGGCCRVGPAAITEMARRLSGAS